MTKTPIAILISGTGSNMAALLYNAKRADCPYEIVLVASNNPAAPGLMLAEAEGVKTFAHSHKGMKRDAFDQVIDAAIQQSGAEIVVLAGYMRILSSEFVAKWSDRLLNIHPSLLPKYPGLDTHQRAIDAGDQYGGCSVHLVIEALDDGPVLGQTKVKILPNDTADDLAKRVLIAEHQLYPRCVEAFVSRETSEEFIRERLRQLALSLPETHERTSHGATGWRVGSEKSGKFFAYLSVHHHGEPDIALLVKTSGSDEQAALVDRDPATYYLPAYYAPSGWIGIRLNRPGVDWDSVSDWLQRSWAAVAPARVAKLARIAAQF